ncbi:gliding motility-associated C-terminal domain-containing protein [Flavobacterium sp. SM15]|uniref:T9SS type B sorting domain-containing protein n=1 Tax=Flavobacterium sp. SM15 TaxID=2908005 RepID=UPI001EDBE960|nr:gliding motility-associated C-terminal domain-containing protein [Flavobacterium sp. SM15]MCG2611432.1 gliding motility-associated C-terminal domain-containing protein [Flavobacterium sp. SM15]
MKSNWYNKLLCKAYILLILTTCSFVRSQSKCYNSDFSAGDFTGWTGYYGTYQIPGQNEGILENDRHGIILTPFQDYNTCNQLTSVPPGENFSAKLGNSMGGGEAEKLVFNVSVTEDTALFIYKYAVVLEDPGHPMSAQPRFSMRVLDSNNHVINPACGVYNVYAGQPNQDFRICELTGVTWLPWKTVGLDLTPYIGQNLSIEFITRDCAYQEHFGYAYITAKCVPLRANVRLCSEGDSFTLTGPNGFASYNWFYQGQPIGTPSQSITLPLADYAVGSVFQCNMIAYSNGNTCPVTTQAVLTDRTIITPNFNETAPCNNNNNTNLIPINFNNQSTIVNGVVTGYHWDFGDDTESTEQHPSHIFTTPGTYTVKLTVTSESGCSSSISKNVVIGVNSLPEPILDANYTFCFSYSLTLASINANGQNLLWYNSPTSLTPLPFNQPLTNTTYYSTLITNGCPGPRKAVNIEVLTVPLPQGNTLQKFCKIEVPTISDLIATGNSIKWYSSSTATTPLATTTPLTTNTYFASQSSSEGCESNRLAVSVIVDDFTSDLPDDYDLKLCNDSSPAIRDLNITQKRLLFYESISSTTPLSENQIVNDDSTFYVSMIDPITGCESSDRFVITVQFKPCQVEIYNMVSIDNNYLNDYLAIKNIESFPENSLEIYNRYGQLVYETQRYGIDGNLFYGIANAGTIYKKGEKLPTGTYYYIITYTGNNSLINDTKKGFLYITNNE